MRQSSLGSFFNKKSVPTSAVKPKDAIASAQGQIKEENGTFTYGE